VPRLIRDQERERASLPPRTARNRIPGGRAAPGRPDVPDAIPAGKVKLTPRIPAHLLSEARI
jgi:hypothetical protein